MDPASLDAGIPWDFESFPEYLRSVEQHGSVLNFAAYIGHTPLRIYVMGGEASTRVAEAGEIEEMARLVREAVEAGACGFATSFAVTHLGADGRPIPSRVADRAEIERSATPCPTQAAASVGINGASEGLHFNEIYDLQLELDVPDHLHALPQRHRRHLKGHWRGIARAREGG
jgi:N-acyl-D-aspartate/D-glutamate deacylase